MRLPILVLALAAVPAALHAQSFEGSKWSIEQEGADSASLWWLGSQGRVRTGDVGTILAGYKWRQSGDSIFVSVGDTVRYSGQLISNRFVGIRTGPRRQEGWWSGSRADAPTAVAAAPATSPAAPAATAVTQVAATETPKPANTNTETMSRPIEPTGNAATTAAAPRTLRRIERSDGSTTPSSTSSNSGGQEIRRIQRGNTLPATTPVPREALVGRWVQADSGGVIVSIAFKEDGSMNIGLNTGSKGEGTWSNETEGTRAIIGGTRREAVIRVWQEGAELRLVVETATGSPVTRRFRRAG